MIDRNMLLDLLRGGKWFVEYANKKGEIKTRVLTLKDLGYESRKEAGTYDNPDSIRAYDPNNLRWVNIRMENVLAVNDYQEV